MAKYYKESDFSLSVSLVFPFGSPWDEPWRQPETLFLHFSLSLSLKNSSFFPVFLQEKKSDLSCPDTLDVKPDCMLFIFPSLLLSQENFRRSDSIKARMMSPGTSTFWDIHSTLIFESVYWILWLSKVGLSKILLNYLCCGVVNLHQFVNNMCRLS